MTCFIHINITISRPSNATVVSGWFADYHHVWIGLSVCELNPQAVLHAFKLVCMTLIFLPDVCYYLERVSCPHSLYPCAISYVSTPLQQSFLALPVPFQPILLTSARCYKMTKIKASLVFLRDICCPFCSPLTIT